jgi:hypothetical protein
MKAKTLEAMAVRRFGEDWPEKFARRYGVAIRTVRHWRAGNFIPQWVEPALSDAITAADVVKRAARIARAGSRRRAGERVDH